MKYCPQCQRRYSKTQRFCPEDGEPLLLQDPYHLAGRTLAEKYRLDGLIGLGGMGAVYSAHHLGIDRRVAVKILQPNLALGDHRVLGLFEREAKMTGRLLHENIAIIMDAGRTADGIAYIVMEWLDGRTLEEELSAHGPLSLERTARILRQVAAALAVAHAGHIIHRDLKPSNVMLIQRPDGGEQVKVLDFGIGKVISETTASPVSAVMGTPHYASPEQFRLGGHIDGRADIYSLGVMLYQMLTGALPFEATSVQELLQLQLTALPPPVRKLRPEVPAAVEQLVNSLLAKDPDQRPSRASDLPALIDRAFSATAESPPAGDQPAVKGEPSPQPAIEATVEEQPATLLDQVPESARPGPTLIDSTPPAEDDRHTPASAAAAQWQQVNQLLDAVLGREPGERAAFLAEACAGDEALRHEVESLLAAHEQAGSFLEAPPLEAAELLAENRSRSMVGRNFGHYQILSLLGAGGMGEVYLTQDLKLGRRVALKLLPAQFTKDEDRVRRFEQEARAASALNHPNIITIYEIGEVDGTHFIVTEFVDGQTLRQQMASAQTKLGAVLDIAIQVASALVAAHEAGIVHRDIKPENIMVRPDGIVKVLDFGLAKLIERFPVGQTTLVDSEASAKEQIRTDPGKVMGTPRYVSPEQVRGWKVDGRSDVFSLGVVLYEMVTGRAPFEGATPVEVIAEILNRETSPLQRYSREAPAELERIVNKALAKDREVRYQGVKDLLIDLKNLKLELELEAKLKRVGQEVKYSEMQPTQPLTEEARQAPSSQARLRKKLEPVGGAVPLDSEFYIVRSTDEEFRSAITRQDSIVLVKGARQVGKTSLLARGLQQARETGAKIVLTDFQELTAACLESVEKLVLTLAEGFADQLDLDVLPNEMWKPHLSPGTNFERYLRREVFVKVPSPIVWGLDEVDRLFTCDFGSEVFGMFRSWHNKRALDPTGPWRRLTLAIAYATEAHLFITDLNQSPFNVGTRLALDDFNFEQVAELNRRYGSPLRDKAEVARYFRLVSGHPYLVRRGLHELVTRGLELAALEAQADHDEGPFGDHLRRLLVSLTQDQALCEVVRGMLQGQPCPTPESFYRLRSAGLMLGDSARDARPRCQLYATYLERHLL